MTARLLLKALADLFHPLLPLVDWRARLRAARACAGDLVVAVTATDWSAVGRVLKEAGRLRLARAIGATRLRVAYIEQWRCRCGRLISDDAPDCQWHDNVRQSVRKGATRKECQ